MGNGSSFAFALRLASPHHTNRGYGGGWRRLVHLPLSGLPTWINTAWARQFSAARPLKTIKPVDRPAKDESDGLIQGRSYMPPLAAVFFFFFFWKC